MTTDDAANGQSKLQTAVHLAGSEVHAHESTGLHEFATICFAAFAEAQACCCMYDTWPLVILHVTSAIPLQKQGNS